MQKYTTPWEINKTKPENDEMKFLVELLEESLQPASYSF